MWNHDADPTEGLRVNHIISRFRQHMAEDPKYLQKYVQKYFVVSCRFLLALTYVMMIEIALYSLVDASLCFDTRKKF